MTSVTDVQQRGGYPQYQRTQRLELTPEEAKAFMECSKNMSVIAPTLFGVAVGYGISRITLFRAHTKYIALVGGVVGALMGRIGISHLCLGKVANMPNSTLRDRLIEAGYYGNKAPYRESQHRDFQPMNVQAEVQSLAEPSTAIVFDDYPQMNTYDTYSSINGQSDFQISEETDLTEPVNQQKNVSYDELRYQNRNEFYKKSKQWYTPRTREPPAASETTGQVPRTGNQSPMQEKTKYGDVWD